jgi:hypothetical protein
MRAFFLPLPALKILQTQSAKSVSLPKLQARCRLERSRYGGGRIRVSLIQRLRLPG